MAGRALGIGIVGSGFVSGFHVRSLVAVRDVEARGVWSPTRERAEARAAEARALGVGECRAFGSLEEMATAPEIDAVWICGPNFARVDNLRAIVEVLPRRRKPLLGVCCEKPLARSAEEAAAMLDLVRRAGLRHGYLENQVFAPAVARGHEIAWRRGAALTGRPHLARCAEEHGGPHEPWFWRKELQGGGVLLDMLCHSVEAGRFLLTPPGAPRAALHPRSVSAQVANLKWTRPEYARKLAAAMPGTDYLRSPAEDFARATVLFEDADGREVMLETTSSWAYTGPGLRLAFELHGPEYALQIDSLRSPLQVYFSREVRGAGGEDLVEKQNAEQGLLPVVEDEAASYGYVAENRHMVRAFLEGRAPALTFDDGAAVVGLLMDCYRSAREGRVVAAGTA